MGQWIRESEASETEFSKLRGKLLNETSDSIVDRGESCRILQNWKVRKVSSRWTLPRDSLNLTLS